MHNRKDLDCLHFQGFCEEGHYGGPHAHGTTRQGIYCCTPSGKFLASVNTTDPRRMERMLRDALAAWKAMPAKERLLTYDPAKRRDEIQRRERQYPEDGLPLRVYTRDRTLFIEHRNDWSLLRTAVHADITTWLVDSILAKVDRATMGVGLEARSPLLDARLMEFAFSTLLADEKRNAGKRPLRSTNDPTRMGGE